MRCDEARLKVHALSDRELPEEEISAVIDHVQSCYACRGDYVELLRLERKMDGLAYAEPSKEWFERLPRRVLRNVGSRVGRLLFIGSYLLLAAYAVYSLFADSRSPIALSRAGTTGTRR